MPEKLEIQAIVRVTYVVEIQSTEDDLPKPGAKFKDAEGRFWWMRSSPTRAGLARLSNPPPPLPEWEITLQSDHPIHTLMSGQQLEQTP